jgi:hypothetical protein
LVRCAVSVLFRRGYTTFVDRSVKVVFRLGYNLSSVGSCHKLDFLKVDFGWVVLVWVGRKVVDVGVWLVG